MAVVFAYGCLMDPRVMARRVASAEPWGGRAEPERSAGRLTGVRLGFPLGDDSDWGGAVAGLVPDEGAAVEGVLWRIDDAGLATLDIYEEIDAGVYERQRRRIAPLHPTDDGPTDVEAWVYFARLDAAIDHRPSAAYLIALRSGADHFHLTETYRRHLASIPTAQPD